MFSLHLIANNIEIPRVEMLAWKHDFTKPGEGTARYQTLMVSGVPGNFHATMFGTEREQISQLVHSMQDGCAIIEYQFKQEFPEHECGQGCNSAWQTFVDKEPRTSQIQ